MEEAMTTERFLGLLNKHDRTPEEEQELQTELKRQATAQQAEANASVGDAVPAQEEPKPAEVAQEAAPAPEAQPVASEPYSLDQLRQETEDAIKFLETQEQTINIEMAKASFTQAAYWIGLSGK